MKRTVIIHALLPVFKTIKNKNHKIYMKLICGDQVLYTTTFPYKKEMWFNQKFDFDTSESSEILSEIYAIELPEKDENNKEIVRSQSTVKFSRPDGIPPSDGLSAIDGGEKGLLIGRCKIDSSLKYVEKKLDIRAARNAPAPLHPADQESKPKPGWKRPADYEAPKPKKAPQKGKQQTEEEKIATERKKKMKLAKERELDVKYHMFQGKILVTIEAPKLKAVTKTKLDRTQECFEKHEINADVTKIVEEAEEYAEKKYDDFIHQEFQFFNKNHNNMQKIREDNEKYREAKALMEAEKEEEHEEIVEEEEDQIPENELENGNEDEDAKVEVNGQEIAETIKEDEEDEENTDVKEAIDEEKIENLNPEEGAVAKEEEENENV